MPLHPRAPGPPLSIWEMGTIPASKRQGSLAAKEVCWWRLPKHDALQGF